MTVYSNGHWTTLTDDNVRKIVGAKDGCPWGAMRVALELFYRTHLSPRLEEWREKGEWVGELIV